MEDEKRTHRHLGVILAAIAVLSSLSVLTAHRIGEARDPAQSVRTAALR